MKIYLAAKWSRMAEMASIGDTLKGLGQDITSQWIYFAEEGKTREENAVMDMEDVRKADAIICYTHPRNEPQPGGGRHTEFGLAVAWGKRLFIVGPQEQIFHWLPGVKQFASTEEMLQYFTPAEKTDNV